MNLDYPQWSGFHLPFTGRLYSRAQRSAQADPHGERIEVPDHHSQLEELPGHVRRCERWAHLDDRIDLSWRLEGSV